ncbi:hypothetical protein ACF3NT_07035 [Naumannella halotolerans]|uniref:hypothetical protein n=1 Tax=Naumannella halotolerans TaxID=993414 RepID=UPI00370D89FA
MIDADTVDRGSALMSELWEHVVMRFDEMLSEAELTGTLPSAEEQFQRVCEGVDENCIEGTPFFDVHEILEALIVEYFRQLALMGDE